MISREVTTDGSIRLKTDGCCYTIVRLRPGVLLLRIEGKELGELGRAPLGEVAAEAALHPPLRLFIDLSRLTSISDAVSDDCTAWFRANRASIRKLDALPGSILVQLTVAVSQVLSHTGDMMRIHNDRDRFESAIREVSPNFPLSSADMNPPT
jgi:hypothetical protein